MTDSRFLSQRIAAGDSQAEHELFQTYEKEIETMVRIRMRYMVSEQDREDVVAEIKHAVLLSLRKGAFDPQTGKTVGAYIAGIGANTIAQYFRKRERGEKFVSRTRLDVEPISVSGNPLAELLDNECRQELNRCLNKLKPKYRQVLLLRIYEGKSIEEISQQLGIKPRRVSERIHYAFKLFVKICQKRDFFQYEKGSDKDRR